MAYVWILMETIPYDGSVILGVYTSEEQLNKALKEPHPEDPDDDSLQVRHSDWLHIAKVAVDVSPHDPNAVQDDYQGTLLRKGLDSTSQID